MQWSHTIHRPTNQILTRKIKTKMVAYLFSKKKPQNQSIDGNSCPFKFRKLLILEGYQDSLENRGASTESKSCCVWREMPLFVLRNSFSKSFRPDCLHTIRTFKSENWIITSCSFNRRWADDVLMLQNLIHQECSEQNNWTTCVGRVTND